MSRKVDLHVGTMEDMGRRFMSAWRRLENGVKVRERHLIFEDLPALPSAITPKRLELLREVRREATQRLDGASCLSSVGQAGYSSYPSTSS